MMREMFDEAQAAGFNFVRVWAFTVQASYPMQVRGAGGTAPDASRLHVRPR